MYFLECQTTPSGVVAAVEIANIYFRMDKASKDNSYVERHPCLILQGLGKLTTTKGDLD